MSTVLIAEFAEANACRRAGQQHSGRPSARCLLLFPVWAWLLGATSTRLRLVMAIGGLGMAALMFGTEWFSAVIDYPIQQRRPAA